MSPLYLLLTVALALSLMGASAVKAQQTRLNLIVAVDLSASVASRGPDDKTDFEKNVAAIDKLLERVPAGSRVTIIGITAASLGEPDVLLSARGRF